MNIILLFYKYVPIESPVTIMRWQKKLCSELGLTGRIIIAEQGVNGTLEGSVESTQIYKKTMLEHPLFGGIDFKEAESSGSSFPRMRIVVKSEIVNTGLQSHQGKLENTGIHLTPTQAHELIASKPENLVIFDARNTCESAIGAFTGAIKPEIDTFRSLPTYIDEHLDTFKGKQVLMYCTGGIRCERATAYLKEQGVAEKVYQIEGGIHRYVEQFPEGYFRGKNYVFDGRIAVKVNDDILGSCALCKKACDDYHNCLNARCNDHFICCKECMDTYSLCCSAACAQALTTGTVQARPVFAKSARQV